MVAPDQASMKCAMGIHGDCLFGDGLCGCTCHVAAVIEEPGALERIEFHCRHLMTELGRMQVRGFDSGRAKAAKRAELDDELDLYNLHRSLEG